MKNLVTCMYFIRLKRYHCDYNFYNMIPKFRKIDFSWSGLNTINGTLLRTSTILFQPNPFLSLFSVKNFSRINFLKKVGLKLRKKYVRFYNIVPIQHMGQIFIIMKFFIKIVSSFDLINIHIVPDSQVKIALNLKKVLVGLVKIDDIATEININKFMLKVRMEDKSKKRLELYNFVKFFNLIVKDRIS